MKKGFTLIELLAVIVILAIIALIATPIILGIINDARKESNERSVELYASAVRNAIASYQLTHPNAPTKFSDLDIQNDGEVECAKEELYADGSFYIAECTVNGTEVDYTYGTHQTTQVYKPQHYSWSRGYIGEDLPSDAKANVSEIDTKGHPFYVGLDVDANNRAIAQYICFIKNETEYCLKGTSDGSAYETNKTVLEDIFGASDCSFDGVHFSCYAAGYSDCGAAGFYVDVDSFGNVSASEGDIYAWCYVYGNDGFECGGS